MSQEVRFEYAMKAARAAEGDGGNAGLSLVPHARREIPALTPLGWDRSRGTRPATPFRPARRAEAKCQGGLGMVEAAPDLENTKARLIEAADALRRLNMLGIKPGGLRAQWPDVVHRAEEAYGWTAERMRPPRPSPAQITRMDEALGWLLWLDDDQRKIVWARCMGLSWRRIEDIDGRSIRTLQNLFATALRLILLRRTSRETCEYRARSITS
ncbi:MAG TPA: DUF6362 family protein [Alphaproteobacteria bacterium]|nr:DUF6362 family protein [Alphaproteobacteria bacterium]